MSERYIIVVTRMKIKDGSEDKALELDLSELPRYSVVEDAKGGVFVDYYMFNGESSNFTGSGFSEAVADEVGSQVEADLGVDFGNILEEVQYVVTSWKIGSEMPIDWNYS